LSSSQLPKDQQEYVDLLGESRRFDLIRVRWIDSRFDGDWQDVKKLENPDLGTMVTAGLLLDWSEKSVTICLSRDKLADTVYGAITIPLLAITSMELLEVEGDLPHGER